MVDRYDTDPVRAVIAADMAAVAVLVGRYRSGVAAIVPRLSPDAVVTDVGSAKGSVVADVDSGFTARYLPISCLAIRSPYRKERGGSIVFDPVPAEAVILMLLAETAAFAHQLVKRMWEITGPKWWTSGRAPSRCRGVSRDQSSATHAGSHLGRYFGAAG